jgi:hypothetical protein
VAGAIAAPAASGKGTSLTGDTRFSATTKPDGTFEMLLPASGACDYNLIAHDGDLERPSMKMQWRNWANGVSEPFRTKPGQTIERLELRLTRPATIHGRVANAEGKPLADRMVLAQAADLRDNRYYQPPPVRTDANGRFEFKFIRPGKQTVQVASFRTRDGKVEGANWSGEIAEGATVEVPDLVEPARPTGLVPRSTRVPRTSPPAEAR